MFQPGRVIWREVKMNFLERVREVSEPMELYHQKCIKKDRRTGSEDEGRRAWPRTPKPSLSIDYERMASSSSGIPGQLGEQHSLC